MILAPTIDIAEVGAGGGSIAYLDSAGGLRVGPRSAGAVPGPACYQRGGTEPTVTDANVLLGYIRPGKLAAGDIEIDPEAARRAFREHIAQPLEMDPMTAALGIHRIADAHMLRALREVSTQRGRDPRIFSMLAVGGSGPVHAASLARELGVGRVVIPPLPGLFSALGLLIGGLERHDVRSCQLRGGELTAQALRGRVDEMRRGMIAGFQRESTMVEWLTFESFAEVRYVGQASRIRVRLPDVLETEQAIPAIRQAFEAEHLRLNGHRSEEGNAIEVVAVRLIGRAPLQRVDLRNAVASQGTESRPARAAMFGQPWGIIQTASIRRSDLRERTRGPLLIDEYDSTIVVPPDFVAHLDSQGNVVMELENARES
jgi:N-methylhydantoinase A